MCNRLRKFKETTGTGTCFTHLLRLIMSQLTTFNMIGIVGQVNLSTMIDAAF